MKSFDFINKQQFVNDAAQIFLENHINHSDSLSCDIYDSSKNLFTDAVKVAREGLVDDPELKAEFGFEDPEDYTMKAIDLVNDARKLANDKWKAVKLLLGF